MKIVLKFIVFLVFIYSLMGVLKVLGKYKLSIIYLYDKNDFRFWDIIIIS